MLEFLIYNFLLVSILSASQKLLLMICNLFYRMIILKNPSGLEKLQWKTMERDRHFPLLENIMPVASPSPTNVGWCRKARSVLFSVGNGI